MWRRVCQLAGPANRQLEQTRLPLVSGQYSASSIWIRRKSEVQRSQKHSAEVKDVFKEAADKKKGGADDAATTTDGGVERIADGGVTSMNQTAHTANPATGESSAEQGTSWRTSIQNWNVNRYLPAKYANGRAEDGDAVLTFYEMPVLDNLAIRTCLTAMGAATCYSLAAAALSSPYWPDYNVYDLATVLLPAVITPYLLRQAHHWTLDRPLKITYNEDSKLFAVKHLRPIVPLTKTTRFHCDDIKPVPSHIHVPLYESEERKGFRAATNEMTSIYRQHSDPYVMTLFLQDKQRKKLKFKLNQEYMMRDQRVYRIFYCAETECTRNGGECEMC